MSQAQGAFAGDDSLLLLCVFPASWELMTSVPAVVAACPGEGLRAASGLCGFGRPLLGLIICSQSGQAHLYCSPQRSLWEELRPLPARALGVEAGVSIPTWQRRTQKSKVSGSFRGYSQDTKLALGSQVEPTAPCCELFREAALRGRLSGQMGFMVACLSPRHTGWFRGLLPGEEFWMALALGRCLPLRPWCRGRSSEPRARSWEAAKYVAVRRTTLREERPHP